MYSSSGWVMRSARRKHFGASIRLNLRLPKVDCELQHDWEHIKRILFQPNLARDGCRFLTQKTQIEIYRQAGRGGLQLRRSSSVIYWRGKFKRSLKVPSTMTPVWDTTAPPANKPQRRSLWLRIMIANFDPWASSVNNWYPAYLVPYTLFMFLSLSFPA